MDGTQVDTQSVSAGSLQFEIPETPNKLQLETSLMMYTKASNRCILQNI